MIWSLIVGYLIGAVAGFFTDTKFGCFGTSIAGLIGAWIGQSLFGHWGPTLAGMSVLPAIIGAVLVIAVVSYITD